MQVVENWTFSLFFCSAELWGSVVIAVLFWSLANDVCTMEEVRYPIKGPSGFHATATLPISDCHRHPLPSTGESVDSCSLIVLPVLASQAKSVYPMTGMAANLALVASGTYVKARSEAEYFNASVAGMYVRLSSFLSDGLVEVHLSPPSLRNHPPAGRHLLDGRRRDTCDAQRPHRFSGRRRWGHELDQGCDGQVGGETNTLLV
jgi:hypothetical protein